MEIGSSLLHLAVRTESTSLISLLRSYPYKRYNLYTLALIQYRNMLDCSGHTPLVLAILRNSITLIEELLLSGENINFANEKGWVKYTCASFCLFARLQFIMQLLLIMTSK